MTITTTPNRTAAAVVAAAGAEPATVTEAEAMTALSPEDQIANVLHSLDLLVNGSSHRYRMDAIRSTVAQLGEMWEQYRADELMPIPDDGIPF